MRHLIILFLLLGSQPLQATIARSAGMGIGDYPWMSFGQLGYVYANPATAYLYRNTAWFENTSAGSEGGLLLSFNQKLTLGILSGRPTNNDVLNNGLGPRGVFDTGANDYLQYFNTQPGENLDASATSSSLGNIASRVSRLDDPSENKLLYRQAQGLLVFDLGPTKLGFMFGYGYASVEDSYEGVASRESLKLFKSEAEGVFGFYIEPGSGPFYSIDGSLGLTFYGVNNTYAAENNLKEKIDASFETSGAHDLTLNLRLGLAANPKNITYTYFYSSFLDSSSIDNAKSEISPFVLNYRDTYSRTGWLSRIGVANTLRFSSFARLITGVQLEYFTHKNVYDGQDKNAGQFAKQPYESRYKHFRLPFVLGMNTQLNRYIQLRFALIQGLINKPASGETQTILRKLRENNAVSTVNSFEETSRTISNNATTEIKLGFSVLVGNLTLDWLSQVKLFRQGPYFLSGASNDLSTRVAATITFNNEMKEAFGE